MTCRVHVAALPEARLNETDCELLRLIAERAHGSLREVPIGLSEMSEGIGRSVATVKRSYSSLARQGLIEVLARHLANGGRMENAYRLTRDGYVVLASVGYAPQLAASR